LGLIPVLNRRAVEDRVPILGICLGMHLMARKSEEGILPGLGWVPGDVKKFRFEDKTRSLKVPHMGWNEVMPRRDDPLFVGFDEETRFYFVHSYHLVCDTNDDELATAWYGYDFSSAVRRENIVGVQFHPEKSHRFGMRLLQNFANGDELRCCPE
jgi:glutamine amidotransferase